LARRGRPRKNDIQNKTELTEKEVFDVFEVVNNFSGFYQNVYTPDLVNSRLKDINMNPDSTITEDKVNSALANPTDNEDSLIGFSEFFEYTNMIYKRMLNYLGNMLSFDVNYQPINARTDKDYTSKQYQKDLEIVEDFFDKLNVKNELQKITRQMIRQECYFGTFRNAGNKYVFQELPRKYCLLTGRSEYGYTFDFNMYWFLQPGVSLDMYPPYFKELYKRVFSGKSNFYDPAMPLSSRDSNYVYWAQTSQENDCWCFKFNQEQAGQVPTLAPLFSDIVLTPNIRQLQKDKYMLQAYKLIFGLVPMLKDNKSGNVKDMMALDAGTIGKFLGLIKSALGDAVHLTAAPFDGVETVDFDVSDQNVLADHNKNTVATSGFNSRLLYSSDKMNIEETKNAISIDSSIMTYLYPQFEDFLNYYVNKLTKKYKFKVTLLGTNFDLDRRTRLDNAMTLANVGIVLPQQFSAALGMMPRDLERQMEMAKYSGFNDKLIPLISMFQQSGKDGNDKGGRPQKSSDELTENGAATRENGDNLGRGGKV
jgi:hypothetical protein